ncbi:hypothetical protein AncyloWKF20_14530 [Ancylobacter sp. WKF20]|uniref:hypothetical protein n=1 Tax=Ancylobacter sp. WKF20 TaxID=3039801 RepID=UPI0024345426|nr:hypothetical protein [Ancylobacter sp. WKF20]WGD28997.1 hypothetical protein AncyloWKF20_14530 [Ancylobacter sp. WKF20]
MATILLSTLLQPADRTAAFFSSLIGALETKGHQVWLWAPGPLAGFEARCLPMPYAIRDWLRHYPVAPSPVRDAETAKWIARLKVLTRQGCPASLAPQLYEIVRGVSEHVLATVQPDLFVAWNPYEVRVGVTYDLCRERGIATATLERAPLPNTWHLDSQDHLAGSRLRALSYEDIAADDAQAELCRQTTAALFAKFPLEGLDRYRQQGGGTDLPHSRKRIVFLTTDDMTVGIHPTDHPDRRMLLPGFLSSFDAARAVAEAHPDKDVLLKVHPNALHLVDEQDYPGNVSIVDGPPAPLLKTADVVVSMGGSLTAMAIGLGKPVVHLVHDAYHGKGIFFEIAQPDELGRAIDAAMTASPDELARRRARFDIVSGYMLRSYVVSHPAEVEGLYGVAQAVEMIDRHLAQRVTAPTAAAELPAAPAADAAHGFHPAAPSPDEVRAALTGPSERTVFLDFDHTLFAGNTTEEYLRQARPALLVSLILAFVRGFLPWRKFFGRHWFRFRDYAAVVAVTLLLPWNLARWRRNAPALFAARGTHELAQALKVVPAERTVIVSFGFDMLIGPLVKGTHWESCRRACVPFQLHPRVLKTLRHGKARLIGGLFPPRVVATAALVTDSEDDRDLLDRVKVPLLVEPVGEKSAAEESFYLPMRYTALAKYNAHYVRKQTLFVELPLLLLATLPLAGAPWLWLGAALALFVSMLAVYEIGYFENDQVAAAREANPTLTPMAARFRDFPLARHAWSWAIALGLVGALLASLRLTGGVFDSDLFAILAGVWIVVLLVVRGLFAAYNRLPEARRIFVYPLLQAAKLLAPLLLIPGLALGAALLLAQTVAMWMTYAVYRAGGDKAMVPRETVRLTAFLALAAGTLLASPSGTLHTEAVAGVLILAWLLRERWVGVIRRPLVAAAKTLKTRLAHRFASR